MNKPPQIVCRCEARTFMGRTYPHRRGQHCRLLAEDQARTEADDATDDPRHGQADAINSDNRRAR